MGTHIPSSSTREENSYTIYEYIHLNRDLFDCERLPSLVYQSSPIGHIAVSVFPYRKIKPIVESLPIKDRLWTCVQHGGWRQDSHHCSQIHAAPICELLRRLVRIKVRITSYELYIQA